MDVHTLKLDPRSVTGKKVRQLRRQGLIPVHLYGAEIEPQNLQVDDRTLNRLLPQVGSNVPVSIEYEGRDGDNICFVREVQRHPVSDEVIHVDFLRVDVSQVTTAEVPIVTVGSSLAVSDMAGTLLLNLQTLLIQALPMNMPAEIPVDISGLDDFDASLLVQDLQVPGNVTVLNDPEDFVARVAPPRLEMEAAADEALAEGEEVEGEELEGEGEGEGEGEADGEERSDPE